MYHQNVTFNNRLIEFLALLTASRVSISFCLFTVFKESTFVFLGQLSVTNKHVYQQPVATFEDTMKKISLGPINSLNISNYDSPRNTLKRLCDTMLSQERDNTKLLTLYLQGLRNLKI